MTLTEEHIEFENYNRRLIGFTVRKVEYSEISYEPTNVKPYYFTKFPNLHSVDFSIFLYYDSKMKHEISWDGKFHEYGIGITIDSSSDFSDYVTWDVSYENLWKKFIGTQITNVSIGWETVTTKEQYTGKTENFVYPQDIKIAFSNMQTIFISAAGFLNEKDNEVFGMLDNLTVTDNEQLARQVKMIN